MPRHLDSNNAPYVTPVWQAVSNKSKRQVQIFDLRFNVRFNVTFKFSRHSTSGSTSGSNFNLTFNVRFNVRFIFQPDIQHELRPYQFGGYTRFFDPGVEDKPEEKTVLCVFGEKDRIYTFIIGIVPLYGPIQ